MPDLSVIIEDTIATFALILTCNFQELLIELDTLYFLIKLMHMTTLTEEIERLKCKRCLCHLKS